MSATIIRVKPIAQALQEAKQSLCAFYSNVLNLDWFNPNIEPAELEQIFAEVKARFTQPREPVELTQRILETLFGDAKRDVEKVWGASLPETPKLEVLPYAEFESRVQILDDEVYKAFGKNSRPTCHMTWQTAVYQGIFLMPTHFPYWETDLERADFPYELSLLKQTISGAIAQMFCRQMRGEWKQGYVDKIKKYGVLYAARSIKLVQIFDALTQDKLIEEHPEMALYAFIDNFNEYFNDLEAFNTYRALQALSEHSSLAELAKTSLVFKPNTSAQSKEEFDETLVAETFNPYRMFDFVKQGKSSQENNFN